MTFTILPHVLNFAFVVMAVSLVLCLIRAVKGPTVADKAVGVDTIGVNVMAVITLFSMQTHTVFYMVAVLVIAIMGFVSLAGIAKFLHKGDIIDREVYPEDQKDRGEAE